MRKQFTKPSYSSSEELTFGVANNPIKLENGITIGGGTVYPEINFTLPPMTITQETMPEVLDQYQQMIHGVCKRAVELYAPGIIVEVELLPDMTANPQWGIEVCKVVREVMHEYESKYGLKSAMRVTPNDIRDMVRPPIMRTGYYIAKMFATFEGCAKSGAEFLAIESTGGKEINDEALLHGDIKSVIFALGILGVRDMEYLWNNIVDIAKATKTYPSSDSACGFANTAMVLADRGLIPKVFAAVVRVASVPRSLVAFEMGAIGPSKDCAYEGPYIKTITGYPISMEGKTSACAHLSPVGNIALAMADLWSNETVQNIKLLSDMAPTVYTEQLIYDCRLLNTAGKHRDGALKLRDWLVESDSKLDPQAYVLRPDVVYAISRELLEIESNFIRTKRAAQIAIEVLRNAYEKGEVHILPKERKWLDIMSAQLEDIPDNEEEFWYHMKNTLDLSKFIPAEYGLAA